MKILDNSSGNCKVDFEKNSQIVGFYNTTISLDHAVQHTKQIVVNVSIV